MRVHVIRTNGGEEYHDVAFNEIIHLIEANGLDTVNLRDGRVMLVDDGGWEATRTIEHTTAGALADASDPRSGLARSARALAADLPVEHHRITTMRPTKPRNQTATDLYLRTCVPGTTHYIVGDVAIVHDRDCE
jgi:hypothetical protein